MNKDIKFMSFSSGSSGNCYFLGNEDGGILIDAGISLRKLKNHLAEYNLSYNSFSAILVTHDHMDHINGLGSYCKKLSKPVYATEKLHNALSRRNFGDPFMDWCRCILQEGVTNIDGFDVRYFEVPHDATQTVGFAINYQGHKFVIMTDLGCVTPEALFYAKQAHTVVIEANYDVDMLMAGPYTHELKMRICQGNGHLSNDDCAMAIKQFYHKGLKNIFLCHLSNNNNTPRLAYDKAAAALQEIGVDKGDINLRELPRTNPSELFVL